MSILNWSVLLILVLVLPLGLGMIPVGNMNETKKNFAMLYASGWFLCFAIFELVFIPFILMRRSFTEAVIVYTVVIAILFIYSVVRAHSVIGTCLKHISGFREISQGEKTGWIIAGVCIAIQVFASIFLEYYDGDDSYYMAEAVIAGTFDEMYTRDAYTGYLFGLDVRHALSPVPLYLAWLSKLSGIHSTIIAHSVIAPLGLILMYCVYIQLSDKLLEKYRAYRPLLMIFLAIWLGFGNVSIYTVETFAMTRIWQGKGLMAAVIIPALFLCFVYFLEEKVERGVWWLFISLIISACFATSTALLLVPTIVGIASCFIGWKKKSVKHILKMWLCCLPCVVLGGCYIFLN